MSFKSLRLALKGAFAWWRFRKKLALINVVILDVDGVLTDGGLFYGANGELTKRFDVRDGLGIRLMQKEGVEVVFLSGGRGGATEARAKDLGIKYCLTGEKDKPLALARLCNELSTSPQKMLFVGDDLNDLALKGQVSILIATADATDALRLNSDIVLKHSGGNGAVRELAEQLLQSRGTWLRLASYGWRDQNV